jgi:hypothetical protein
MWNRLAVEAEVSESMLTRFLEDAAFGPDEIAIMVAAYEMGLTQINASGHNDPTAETLAQTIVMLAKQGERDPVRLEQRAIEIMSGQPPDLARSTYPLWGLRDLSAPVSTTSVVGHTGRLPGIRLSEDVAHQESAAWQAKCTAPWDAQSLCRKTKPPLLK